jgi:hypothetical protein
MPIASLKQLENCTVYSNGKNTCEYRYELSHTTDGGDGTKITENNMVLTFDFMSRTFSGGFSITDSKPVHTQREAMEDMARKLKRFGSALEQIATKLPDATSGITRVADMEVVYDRDPVKPGQKFLLTYTKNNVECGRYTELIDDELLLNKRLVSFAQENVRALALQDPENRAMGATPYQNVKVYALSDTSAGKEYIHDHMQGSIQK